MLIGYVSDERYAALPDVLLEFTARRRIVGGVLARAGRYIWTCRPTSTR